MEVNYEKLVRVRQELKLRQIDVAPVVGVKRHVFSRKERGLIGITIEEAYKLAKLYKMSIDELFFGE